MSQLISWLASTDAAALKRIEWSGSLIGLLGAGLLASNTVVSGWGFVAFLLSNMCWALFAVRTRSHGLLVMQIGFTATSLLGIYRWLA